MQLDVRERISLGTLLQELSQKGDYAGLKTLRRAKDMVSFSPDEVKLYELKEVAPNQWNWNGEAAAKNVKDVPVDEFTTNLVRSRLAELNQDHEILEQYLSLYEKFVIAYK
jgi:hypothetical protein